VLSRRRFLAIAAWGATAAVFPGIVRASPQPSRARRLSFHNLHTEERLAVTYWERDAYVPAALQEIDAILRDHRTGEIRPIAPALLDLVHALIGRLGGLRTIQVVSGYRSAATNAQLHAADPVRVAEGSLHLNGEALDLCVDGRSLRKVRDAALALAAGGVGYYPRTGFVHVDVGRPRMW
jgi:uncharacterized protein YcbK (DUF882 family)